MVTAKLEEEPRAEVQELAKLSHLLSFHLICSCEMAAAAMETVTCLQSVCVAQKWSVPVVCSHMFV